MSPYRLSANKYLRKEQPLAPGSIRAAPAHHLRSRGPLVRRCAVTRARLYTGERRARMSERGERMPAVGLFMRFAGLLSFFRPVSCRSRRSMSRSSSAPVSGGTSVDSMAPDRDARRCACGGVRRRFCAGLHRAGRRRARLSFPGGPRRVVASDRWRAADRLGLYVAGILRIPYLDRERRFRCASARRAIPLVRGGDGVWPRLDALRRPILAASC